MAANYDLPENGVVKRVRFFDGQLLIDQDFIDDQRYHLDRQRRTNRMLRVSGICEGLTLEVANNKVTVKPGTALDSLGRLIVLHEPRIVVDSLSAQTGNLDIYIAYQEEESDVNQASSETSPVATGQPAGDSEKPLTGAKGATRWWENPKLEFVRQGSGPTGDRPLFLGRVTASTGALSLSDRQYAGIYLPSSVDLPNAPTLRSGGTENPTLAILTGNLRVTGTSALNGNVSMGGNLAVTGTRQIIFSDAGTDNNLKLQLWAGYGLGINGGTLFYAANGRHSWRDNNGTNERMALTTGADGSLTVTGSGTSSFAGSLSVGSSLTVTANSTLNGTLTVNNTVALKGSSTATGLSVNASGNVSMGGTLSVTGASTLTGTLTVNNTVALKGSSTATGLSVNASGNVSMGGTLSVTGASTLTGNVSIGSTTLGANLDVEGAAMLGYESNITNFGNALKSGFYQNGGQELTGDVPDTAHGWTHLITARHSNTANNHQLQIAASYASNDRLFFRKIAASEITNATNPDWNEVATRATNTFSGNQTIQGTLTVNSQVFLSTGKHASSSLDGGGNIAIVSSAPQIDFIDTDHNDWAIHVNSNKMYFIRQPWTYTDLVLDGAGNVGIGTADPGAKLEVNGKLKLLGNNNSFTISVESNAVVFTIAKSHHGGNSARSIYWDGDTNWDASDRRLKTDIDNESHILDRLMQLDVKNFRWKDEPDVETKKIGFIAQDVQPVFPTLVSENKNEEGDETTLTLNYRAFGVLAVGGLKELKLEKDAEIAQLKAQIQQLQDKLLSHHDRPPIGTLAPAQRINQPS